MKTITFIFNGRLFEVETNLQMPEDVLKNFFYRTDYLSIDGVVHKDRFNKAGDLVVAHLTAANLKNIIQIDSLATDTRELYAPFIGQSVVYSDSDSVFTVIDVLDLPSRAVKISNNTGGVLIVDLYKTRPATGLERASGGRLNLVYWG